MKNLLLNSSLIALSICAAVLLSCQKQDKNAPRSEYIKVYADAACTDTICHLSMLSKGETRTIYIKTNVSPVIKWEDGTIPPWLSVSGLRDMGGGVFSLDVTCEKLPYENCYERRQGNLLIRQPSIDYGIFFRIHQGFLERVGTDFSWLEYGDEDQTPNDTDGETSITYWTDLQKEMGYTSTAVEGEDLTHCYGRWHFIKLGGDNGMGADFIIPYTSAFQNDSLLVVSFKCVAQVGSSKGGFKGDTEPILPGEMAALSRNRASVGDSGKDNAKLVVSVSGGGVIRDGAQSSSPSTSFSMDVPWYDSSLPLEKQFANGAILVFISSTSNNPISANTTIKLTAGDMTPLAAGEVRKQNRLFVSDFHIYRINKTKFGTAKQVDEDLFESNGRKSGLDTVLGGATNN